MLKKNFILGSFLILLCCTFMYCKDYESHDINFTTFLLSAELSKEYRPVDATTNYARFTSPTARITFSYISYIDFANKKTHPMDKGILGLASGTLLETIEKKPNITNAELLEKLFESNSKFLDIDLMYDATSSSKAVKFDSGFCGLSFFTISRDDGDLMSNVRFHYCMLLDNGLLLITVFPYVDKKELLEKLKNGGFGKTRIKSDGEFIQEEGQAQINKIYEAIKTNELDVENLHSAYLDYLDLQKHLDIKYIKSFFIE